MKMVRKSLRLYLQFQNQNTWCPKKQGLPRSGAPSKSKVHVLSVQRRFFKMAAINSMVSNSPKFKSFEIISSLPTGSNAYLAREVPANNNGGPSFSMMTSMGNFLGVGFLLGVDFLLGLVPYWGWVLR